MKKKSILSLALAGVLTMGLIGCGSKNTADDKTIKIGVTPVPHREIVEHVIPVLEEKGYTVEIVEFSDYVQPNTSLEDGALDANYFQTLAYLEEFNKKNGTHLVSASEIHVEPMGAYSYKYKNPDLDHKPEQLAKRGGAHYSDAACETIASIYGNKLSHIVVTTKNNGSW